jgi:hypothetical protein
VEDPMRVLSADVNVYHRAGEEPASIVSG